MKAVTYQDDVEYIHTVCIILAGEKNQFTQYSFLIMLIKIK